MADPAPMATPVQKGFGSADAGLTANRETVKHRIIERTIAFFMVFSPFLFFIILTIHQVKRLKKSILTIYLFFRLNQVKKRYDR